MRDREIVGLWEAYLQVHQPKEEVENWVNSLIDEGYDLSEYTWDDMCEMYMKLDEAKSKIPGDDLFSQFYRGKNARKQKGVKTHQPGQNRYLAQQNQKRSAARYAADMGRDRTPSASDYDNHGGGSRNEQADLFDIIKGHLLDEGFADTEEAALAIMTNMSEEWREQILDEAVRGSGRSIGDIITGDDIRGVTRGNKPVYKKPKWKDDVENKVDREVQLLSDRKNKKKSEMAAGRLTVATKRGIEKATNRSNDGPGGDEFAPGSALRRREEDDQPTDYRARNRRARGR